MQKSVMSAWIKYIVTCQAHPAIVKRVQCTVCSFFILGSYYWSQGGSLESPLSWHVTIYIEDIENAEIVECKQQRKKNSGSVYLRKYWRSFVMLAKMIVTIS